MRTLHAAALRKQTASRHMSCLRFPTNFLRSIPPFLSAAPPLILLPAASRPTTVLISASMLACRVCGSFKTWRRMQPTMFCSPANLQVLGSVNSSSAPPFLRNLVASLWLRSNLERTPRQAWTTPEGGGKLDFVCRRAKMFIDSTSACSASLAGMRGQKLGGRVAAAASSSAFFSALFALVVLRAFVIFLCALAISCFFLALSRLARSYSEFFSRLSSFSEDGMGEPALVVVVVMVVVVVVVVEVEVVVVLVALSFSNLVIDSSSFNNPSLTAPPITSTNRSTPVHQLPQPPFPSPFTFPLRARVRQLRERPMRLFLRTRILCLG
mmetsp:Transcript_17135/g.32027  ORF Transcript_17135/g.32027 Transcript_17135/m.32027 type:complete len:325 (-) Transcript_17135:244-1218(-)